MLSCYIDNTLSAREVWEVEKHLALCADCNALAQQMQATVQILHSADCYDTGDDFMAKLHARLDTLEPEPARGFSLRAAMQDWLSGMSAVVRTWRLPALTVGFAAATLLLFVRSNTPVVPVTPPIATAERAVDLSRQVAFTASNPFDDPVATKAEVDGSSGPANDTHNEANGAPTSF